MTSLIVSHTCDLMLDQNLGREETDYLSLVPKEPVLF